MANQDDNSKDFEVEHFRADGPATPARVAAFAAELLTITHGHPKLCHVCYESKMTPAKCKGCGTSLSPASRFADAQIAASLITRNEPCVLYSYDKGFDRWFDGTLVRREEPPEFEPEDPLLQFGRDRRDLDEDDEA